ncbi:MAG: hypothetical protein ACI8SR_001786 [Oceanicoccus sp.]|jgi:hypothetical protein
MRPRTLARKKLKPILDFFERFGDCMAPCGLSYQQKAIARAQYALDRNLEDTLTVCALLYDLDELVIKSLNQTASRTPLNKDKHAAECLKLTFPDHITKPIRLKAITKQYASQPCTLESGTAKLFEESPWFFACMSLFQIEKKLLSQASTHSHNVSDIASYEELLLSQTLILSRKEKQHA